MLMKNKITPKDVADALGISVQAVRVGLQQGRFPFGTAIKTSEAKFTYAIYPKAFEEYVGRMVNQGGNNQMDEASEGCSEAN
jgi:hypothetical protein